MDDAAFEPAIDAGGGGQAAPPALDPHGRFPKLVDVAASVGLSRSMIYRLMHETPDPFPPPVKVGGASLWVEQEVVAWKRRQIARRRLRRHFGGAAASLPSRIL